MTVNREYYLHQASSGQYMIRRRLWTFNQQVLRDMLNLHMIRAGTS